MVYPHPYQICFFLGVDQIFRHTNFLKWDVLEGNHLEIVNLNENVRFTLDYWSKKLWRTIPKIMIARKEKEQSGIQIEYVPWICAPIHRSSTNSFHYIQKNTKWWLGLSRPLAALGAAHFPEIYSTLAALSGCPMIPSQRWGSTSQHPVPSVTCAASSLAQWQLWF